jgi:hypothetical protein
MTKPPGLAAAGGAQVGRDKALAVHQRHVQVGERRHRAAAAVHRQPGDAGAFQQKVSSRVWAKIRVTSSQSLRL